MKTNHFNNLLARFNLLADNGVFVTMESLFLTEIERLQELHCTIEKKGKDPGFQRKWICKVTLPPNWGSMK